MLNFKQYSQRFKIIPLLYPVLGTLLLVGLLPLGLAGWTLSQRSAGELRLIEGRYQAQLVQDKARQIELFGQKYREVVSGLARAFELAGGVHLLNQTGSEFRLQKNIQQDPNLIAIAIEPVSGPPKVAYKPDVISRDELDEAVSSVLAGVSGKGFVVGAPFVIHSSQEMSLAMAAPVMGGRGGDEVDAAVVALISLQQLFEAVGQRSSQSEQELLERGLPVIFVVDEEGRAVAHPDPHIALAQRPMNDLKVVQEWMASGNQVQSALAPFQVQREGRQVEMLGAYATAELDAHARLGVMAIQDEDAALRSITEMRHQTLLISLVSASFALFIGIIFARQLTLPVRELVAGARRIASGDLGQRIKVRTRTELRDLGESFNLMTDQLEKYIEELRNAAQENRDLFLGIVKAMAAAIDGKDPYTRGHSERVARFSVAIAMWMGLPDDEVEKLRISALLHDVGKIGVDDKILKKPAPLTAEEFEIMKEHPRQGYKIMSQIPAMSEFLPGIYMHHEMVNGEGYPRGLKGDEIPLQARIISVADTFDAMTTERPYQKAMELEAALARISSFVGARYDGEVVAALIEACKSGQVRAGSVRLRSFDRSAIGRAKTAESRTGAA